ncbi:flagellar basal body L-ring protein FlgH [Novosphingobium sp. KACC 22771]|uniref:flagellar basal body L-ring protein FlgH n=1 Tax=Novosphingobium sp. KACC 22771 TaxID=3025670 RepID=UPI0023669DFE|nr:flagellar basal body L-ring protein FlgH [Novosphingobium sp. KACC 22771]WDF74085.1 flagellar basal body L-ring protein FlgH [Novosphingobium sp. KACC 22771]
MLPALAASLVLAAPALAGRRPAPGFEATLPAAPTAAPADGAIFVAAAGYAPLVSGARAQRVGDVLTVILNENTSTAKTSSAKTQRTGSASISATKVGPISIASPPLNGSASGSFNGQGNATQTNSFSGMISVTIAEVRPNGTALVRGEKRMLLAQGKEWIQFSGIVRLADVDAANQIQSGQVADARIEYAGNGTVAQSAREGWLSKFFSYISPF